MVSRLHSFFSSLFPADEAASKSQDVISETDDSFAPTSLDDVDAEFDEVISLPLLPEPAITESTSSEPHSGSDSPLGILTHTASHVKETTEVTKTNDDGNKSINQYSLISTIGKGAYSKVKLVWHDELAKPFAIKIMDITKLSRIAKGEKRTALDDVRREIAIMKKLRHPNLSILYEVMEDTVEKKLYLVLDYLEQGPVVEVKTDGTVPGPRKPLEESRRQFRELISGLHYLHNNNVVHRDIKPDNLLLDGEGVIHLVDFGVSAIIDPIAGDMVTGTEGTPSFLPPEAYSASAGSMHGKSADVWASGVVLYTLLHGKLPFTGLSLGELQHAILSQEPSIDPDLPESARNLLVRMLQKDPANRVTVEEVSNDPFVTAGGVLPPCVCTTPPVCVSDADVANAIKEGENLMLSDRFALMVSLKSKMGSWRKRAQQSIRVRRGSSMAESQEGSPSATQARTMTGIPQYDSMHESIPGSFSAPSSVNCDSTMRSDLEDSLVASPVTIGGHGCSNHSTEDLHRSISTTTQSFRTLPDRDEVKSTSMVTSSKDEDGNKMINAYQVITTLGKGSYSKVKLVVHNDTDQLYAIKIMDKSLLRRVSKGDDRSALDDVLREIAIMKKMRHPNLVSLYEVLDDTEQEKLYLVVDYLEKGPVVDLNPDQTVSGEPLSVDAAREKFRDILTGLLYLHQHGIVHRDLKPDNLLMDSDGRVRITDFGVSAILDDEGNSDIIQGTEGTWSFLPPEAVAADAHIHGFAADVWAAGVVLFLMLHNCLPFRGRGYTEVTEQILHTEPVINSELPEDVQDVLRQMLIKDPHARISLADLDMHPFITANGTLPSCMPEASAMQPLTVSDDDVSKAVATGHNLNLRSADKVALMIRLKMKSSKWKAKAQQSLLMRKGGDPNSPASSIPSPF